MGTLKLTIWQLLVAAMSQPSFAAIFGLVLSAMLAVAYLVDAARGVVQPALTKLYADLTNSLRSHSRIGRIKSERAS
jgi:hypothetical protein